jgi:hypothetical protein
MKYTVVDRPSAESHLAELSNDATDRQEITNAADEIDYRLARDPHHEGESRSADTRIVFVRPLAVLFEISDPDGMVRVLKVWRVGLDE